jgi:hypothetical protein
MGFRWAGVTLHERRWPATFLCEPNLASLAAEIRAVLAA